MHGITFYQNKTEQIYEFIFIKQLVIEWTTKENYEYILIERPSELAVERMVFINIVASHTLGPVWEGSGNNKSRDSSEEGSNNNGGEIS